MKPPTENAHWRDSARSIRFFMLDGKSVFPLILVLIYPRLWTVIVAVIATIFFSLLNRYGLTVNIFYRWFRNKAAGNRKYSNPWWME
ncbi:MAG: IcmT/TraK family protein [Coxiellaceae bacterium]|nr:IcmT/TraK family protein [Coxiellaceae bacterium]